MDARMHALIVALGGLMLLGPAMAQTAPETESTIAPTFVFPLTAVPETSTADPSVLDESGADADAGMALSTDDPETLKAAIVKLRAKLRSVVGERDALVGERDAMAGERDWLAAQIDEMTRAGGSLVTAYCASREISRNTAGAEENCYDDGYTCAPVSGLCRTSSSSSDDCAPGFVHYPELGRCGRP